MNTAKNKTSTFPMWKSLFVYMLDVVVFMYENAVRINRVFHVSLRIQRQAAFVHNALSSIVFRSTNTTKGSFCNGVRFFACVLATKSIMHFLSLSKAFFYTLNTSLVFVGRRFFVLIEEKIVLSCKTIHTISSFSFASLQRGVWKTWRWKIIYMSMQ